MKKFLRLLFVFAGVTLFCNSALASGGGGGGDSSTPPSNNPTHGATCTVKTNDSAAGLVYVNSSVTTKSMGYNHWQPAAPNDDEYVAEMTTVNESEGGGTTTEAMFYLYAKPNPGYKFVRWDGSQSSTENPFNMKVSHSTKLPNHNPYYMTAYFIQENAVNTESNVSVGRIKLEPEAPQIGEKVKATAEVVGLSQNNTTPNKNMMIVFDHWEKWIGDECADNNFGSDTDIEFEVTEEITLKAVFRELGGLPQKGKYYRVRNVYNRVLTLEGGYKVNIPMTGTDIDDSLLRWALPIDHDYNEFWTSSANNDWEEYEKDGIICPEASPNTIFYMSEGSKNGDNFTNGVLTAQGVDTKTLTGQTLQVTPVDEQYYGYYGVVAQTAAGAGFKAMPRPADPEKNLPARCLVNVSSFQSASIYCALAIQPIDEEHIDDFWFGAKPEEAMWFDGGYWTSMYTSFPYECYEEDGVEAYYITEATTKDNVTYALMTKIEDGRVPANSGVLLKCKSLNTKENRLLPLDPETKIDALEGNVLEGVFQLYKDANRNGRVEFEEDYMRVFGVDSKKNVGFFKLSNDENGQAAVLKANRAYINMNKFSNPTRAISFIIGNVDGMASIDEIEEDGSSVMYEDNKVFDLMGRLVAEPKAGNIYIVNGKKVLWK